MINASRASNGMSNKWKRFLCSFTTTRPDSGRSNKKETSCPRDEHEHEMNRTTLISHISVLFYLIIIIIVIGSSYSCLKHQRKIGWISSQPAAVRTCPEWQRSVPVKNNFFFFFSCTTHMWIMYETSEFYLYSFLAVLHRPTLPLAAEQKKQ